MLRKINYSRQREFSEVWVTEKCTLAKQRDKQEICVLTGEEVLNLTLVSMHKDSSYAILCSEKRFSKLFKLCPTKCRYCFAFWIVNVRVLIAIISLHGPAQPQLGLPPTCPAALFKLSSGPSLFVWAMLEQYWFLAVVLLDPGLSPVNWLSGFISDLPYHHNVALWSGFLTQSGCYLWSVLLAPLRYCGTGLWLVRPLPFQLCVSLPSSPSLREQPCFSYSVMVNEVVQRITWELENLPALVIALLRGMLVINLHGNWMFYMVFSQL